MNTNRNTVEYEVHMRDARQQRAEEIASLFKSAVAFFRDRRRSMIEKEVRPVRVGKRAGNLWPVA